MISSFFLIVVTVAPLAAQAEDSPKDRTKALIGAFLTVHYPGEGATLTDLQRKENVRSFEVLDGYFGYDELIRGALAGIAAKLAPSERTEFFRKFRELIRWIAYPSAGQFFRDNPYELGSTEKRREVSVVALSSYVAEEDMDMDVAFLWRAIDGSLRLVDIEFDGDSLVKDYRNQFGRIVAKEGTDGLLKRIGKKHDEERAAQGKR